MLKQDFDGTFTCGQCRQELSEKERYFFNGKEGVCRKCAGEPEGGWFKNNA